MKSAVFYGKKDIRIEECPMPQVKADEVLIKVMACGICGTDVHIFEGDKGAANTIPPIILGHEFAGVVVETGINVKDVFIGDRVCVDPNVLCGECYYCKGGVGHFCTGMVGIGTNVNGGFSEFCSVPVKQVYKLAEDITFEMGAMTESLACCLHGIDRTEIKPGSTTVVIGGGMIGLLMVQLCKLKGAYKIVLIEPVEGKRKLGAALGADLCVNSINQNFNAILKEKKIDQVDVVIECVGLPSTINQAIKIAGNNSTIMMFGLTKPDDIVEIKPFDLFQKEIVLKASFINPYTQGRALNLINSKKIDVTSMIYKIEPLSSLPEILSNVDLRKNGKYIINPWKKEKILNHIKACIFDMDGTMIDSERVTRDAYIKAYAQVGLNFTNELYGSIICNGKNSRQILNHHFPDADIDALRKSVFKIMEQRLASKEIPVKKGLYELLDYLEQNNIECILATSTHKEKAIKILKKINVYHRFKHLVCGDDVNKSKPAPDIYLKALKLSELTESQVLVLEDSHNGILAANKAKLPVIMIPDLLPPDNNLLTVGILENLEQIIPYLNNYNQGN